MARLSFYTPAFASAPDPRNGARPNLPTEKDRAASARLAAAASRERRNRSHGKGRCPIATSDGEGPTTTSAAQLRSQAPFHNASSSNLRRVAGTPDPRAANTHRLGTAPRELDSIRLCSARFHRSVRSAVLHRVQLSQLSRGLPRAARVQWIDFLLLLPGQKRDCQGTQHRQSEHRAHGNVVASKFVAQE